MPRIGHASPSSGGLSGHLQASTHADIFRLRAFRSFWFGFTFSGVGDAMTRTVLVWMVYSLTGFSEALGLLLVSYTAPVLIGGLLARSVFSAGLIGLPGLVGLGSRALPKDPNREVKV